jgi:branched-chain amino acid transport system substrate-binding protein
MNKKTNLRVVLALILIINYFSCIKNESKLVIGAILPLSGNSALLGAQHKWGLEYAINEINRSGGIKDKKIKLIMLDDMGEVKNSLSAFHLLVNKYKADIIFSVMSNSAIALKPKIINKDIIFFANVGYPGITDSCDNIFRNFITSDQEASYMSLYCIDSLKIK